MGHIFFMLIMLILFFVGCWKYVDWQNARTEEKTEKRVAEMSQSEKEELLWGGSWKTINGSLPKTCPRCGSKNYSTNSAGYPMSKWKLESTGFARRKHTTKKDRTLSCLFLLVTLNQPKSNLLQNL